MQPIIQEMGNPNVGKVSNEQRQLQQAQLQMQQMAQQMAAMQAQLQESQRPVARSYTFDQIQILLCCETINHVLAEFDLSDPKAVRLRMAREYLLHLGDLKEFLPQQQPQYQQEEEYPEREDENDNPFMDGDLAGGESDDGELPPVERTSKEDIEEINKKMASLKQEEAVKSAEKGKTGIEKIKDFISKKNNPEAKLDSSMQSESMG
jgi:chaperonin cofactor prefoldin